MALFEQDISGCLAGKIGAGGVPEAVLGAVLAQARGALERVRRWHDEGDPAFLRLPALRDDIEPLGPLAVAARARLTDVVVLGTGGSSLGGQTLVDLLAVPAVAAPAPRIHFADNIDPFSFDRLIDALDLTHTLFLVISKSGGTAETLTQFLIVLDRVRGAVPADQIPACFVLITEPVDNPLRRLGQRWDLLILDHDPKVGGRFSVLSPVGLLPAMIAGVDAVALREGAAEILEATLSAGSPVSAEPARGAAVTHALMRDCGITATVLMPYSDRLGSFGLWYRQLWAESLGKVEASTTPIRAVGAVDQHSQLQLYLAGRRDKMYTVISVDSVGVGATVDADLASDPALAYLRGRTMGDLLDAECRATAETLIEAGRPVRRIRVPKLDARAMGGLLMHFMLETLIAAELMGVDAFDQPAVEAGKQRARRYLEESRDDAAASPT